MTGAPSNPANAHESVSDWFRNRRRADGMGNRIDRQRRLRQALIPNAARVSARQRVMTDTAFGAGSSEERGGGKEGFMTGSSEWWSDHLNKYMYDVKPR